MCIIGGRGVKGEAIKENQEFYYRAIRSFYPRKLVKAFECEYVFKLTRSQMCTQAAWPGRFSEKDDNLEHNFQDIVKKQICLHSCQRIMCAYVTATSFGLEVGDAMHDDMMKEQWFVVDLDVSGEQATEVLHIPNQGKGGEGRHKHALSVQLYQVPNVFLSEG